MLGLGVAGAPSLLDACSGHDSGARSRSAEARTDKRGDGTVSGRPNFLLIVADDMRYDHLQYMPKVRRHIQDPGSTFTQARCNVPLCQPSRVGFFTGQMSSTTASSASGFTARSSPTMTMPLAVGCTMPGTGAASSEST